MITHKMKPFMRKEQVLPRFLGSARFSSPAQAKTGITGDILRFTIYLPEVETG